MSMVIGFNAALDRLKLVGQHWAKIQILLSWSHLPVLFSADGLGSNAAK
jgi:hypothetical protein